MAAPREASPAVTPHAALDRAIAVAGEHKRGFANMPPADKAALLQSTLPALAALAEGWVAAGCTAKGLDPESPAAGEEWLAGPLITIRYARLLAQSLREIAARGAPPLGRGARTRPDGLLEVEVFPAGGFDPVLYRGLSCVALLEAGIDEAKARERQAPFYRRRAPEGAVSLVLGAGNVSSIPAADALHKMFVDGNVCVLKMNPVNAWVGPFLERGLRSLVERGFLQIVYGGAEVGAYLCQHPGVDDVHITGSNRTHDLIVWGATEAEQDARRRANDPLLKKTITSELGNVSPVAVVPGRYTDAELDFQARNVASMVVNNASFNCNAAKIVVTSRAWPQRARFFELLEKALSGVAPREAYYPGAHARYAELVGQREGVKKIGRGGEGTLPWTLITGVDAANADEPLFRVEPFCSILSQTDLEASDPIEYLAAVTRFCNERLWGTLNAALIIDPRSEADPRVAQALDRAILDLRYGTVAVNHWPALVFGACSAPWGGHPSATLADVQSGIGWVHNAFMLEGIAKAVFRGPAVMSPKPAWFCDNAMTRVLGPKLCQFEASPSALKLPGLMVTSLRG